MLKQEIIHKFSVNYKLIYKCSLVSIKAPLKINK